MSTEPKILIVDDRPENVVAMEGALRREGLTILKAESGQRALEQLIEHEVALAIVDVQMPEMDGFQLAELMRGSARTREIPLIFVTAGLHDQSRIFRGYESGAVDFLIKPLDPRILDSKVRVFLQLHAQRQQLSDRIWELEQAVRERRRAEQELSEANARLTLADRRKNEFLAMLSHELRNPLAPIRNGLYILRRAAPGSPQAAHALEVMDRQVSQLASLVNELLDVARVTRNMVTLQKATMELGELVRRAVEDYGPQFERSGIRLVLEPASEQMFVEGDGARLGQVFSSLLQNAVKFTARGGATRVAVSRRAGVAVISVTDTGMGMAPDTLSRVFEPFMQAEQSLDRSKGGLGLGLPLAKGVVELHGGEITARSEGPGKGAQFEVRLPLVRAPARRDEEDGRKGKQIRPHRVLIIEDNIDAADSLREVLELYQHEVEVAHDGPEGLAKARRFRPEVVLCDIGLPGMNGYEVARAFREDKAISNAFLVALSGYALPEDLERAAEAGFQRHLAKPASLEKIEAVLSECGASLPHPAPLP